MSTLVIILLLARKIIAGGRGPVRVAVALLVAGALVHGIETRAADYPAKPIKIVVPFPAGSASDLRTRKLAEQLGPKLGQPIIVENRPGAAGTIGAGVVARSAPDGYTLLYATNSILSVAPHVQPRSDFDPLSAFAAIIHLADTPLVVVVPASLPVRSLQDFVAAAKREPGGLAYGTSGVGSIQHIGIEQYAEITGIRLLHVPYKGESEVLTALLGGQISMGYCTLMVCQAYIKNGKLRALAVTAARRLATLPEVPTVAESGAPGYELQAAGGLFAPASTPRDIVDRLYRQSESIIRSRDMTAWTEANGSEVVGGSPQEFMAVIKRDYDRYGKLVKKLGIRADE
jgi:tripartite-type tricarboxylate transporter receptor subunit TctC